MKISEHFDTDIDRMLACPHCGVCFIEHRFLKHMEILRNLWNKGIILTSGCRCEYWNNKVSDGHSRGQHVSSDKQGTRAWDILMTDRYDRRKFLTLIFSTPELNNYFKDIAVHSSFIHMGEGNQSLGLGVY